jgi:hypothetical protein
MKRHPKQKTYIELNSTHRNRVLYPYPSQFEINVIGNSSQGNNLIALDPILDGVPIFSFQGNVVTHSDTFGGGVANAPILGASASSLDGFYTAAVLTNTSTGESSIIESYDGYTKMATLSFPFSQPFNPTDSYSITDISDESHIYWSYGIQRPLYGLFMNDVSSGEYRPISGFNPITKTFLLETPFSAAWGINHQYEITRSQPVSHGIAMSLTTGPYTITLAASEPTTDDTYKGFYIRFIGGPLNNEYRLITAYSGSTKVATFTPIVTSSLFRPQSYEILRLKRDNVVDITRYSLKGDLKVKLLDLMIPKSKLHCNGTIADYPFVYVRITDKNNNLTNAITSNNNGTTRAIFKCPIASSNDVYSSIKLSCDMIQILRLQTTLVFEVLLPSGWPLRFMEPDWTSPNAPNPLLQISCTIECECMCQDLD